MSWGDIQDPSTRRPLWTVNAGTAKQAVGSYLLRLSQALMHGVTLPQGKREGKAQLSSPAMASPFLRRSVYYSSRLTHTKQGNHASRPETQTADTCVRPALAAPHL